MMEGYDKAKIPTHTHIHIRPKPLKDWTDSELGEVFLALGEALRMVQLGLRESIREEIERRRGGPIE